MSKAAELANLIGNINAGGGGVGRNIIINGAMQISQRAISATNPGGGYATLDRFRMSQNSSGLGNFVMSQDASAPTGSGFSKSLKLVKDGATSIGSGNSAYIHYNAEGLDVQHFCYGTSDAKSVTISFWVKSSVTGTYGLSLGDGAAGRGNVQTYSISSADTWEYKSVTFVGDTGATIPNDNTAGFSIHWVLGAGSTYHETSTNTWTATHKLSTSSQTQWTETDGATFFLTGCQAEIGQNPTEFEHEPFDVTLAKCQRYYEHCYDLLGTHFPADDVAFGNGMTLHNANCWADDNLRVQVHFLVRKRAVPTTTAYSVSGLGNGSTANRWDWYDGGWGEMTGATNMAETTAVGIHVSVIDTDATNKSAYMAAGGWDADAEL